jgi:UDP-N-acetylglucosamine 2-epimerase
MQESNAVRVATVCGTRPELIKLAPLVPGLAERFDHVYLFTGQHFSPNMVQVFVDELKAPPPDRFLDVGSSDTDMLMAATEAELRRIRPEVVVVYGDTNSTLAAARAARNVGALLVHIEGGIRSFDRSMPEERARVEVDRLSQLRLAPTGLATWFLHAFEGYDPATSPAVGNLVVDAWLRHRPLIDARELPEALRALPAGSPYAVLTLHRQATVDEPAVLSRILGELATLPFPVWFPVHPRTSGNVAKFGIRWPGNLLTCEPLGYLDFCRAMSGARILLTDSGGVQEEAITLDIPCVTLRPGTERMETVFLGANRLFDPARHVGLRDVVDRALAEHGQRPYRRNPFGSGHSASRCIAALELLAGRVPSVTFPEETGLAGLPELERAAARARASAVVA